MELTNFYFSPGLSVKEFLREHSLKSYQPKVKWSTKFLNAFKP